MTRNNDKYTDDKYSNDKYSDDKYWRQEIMTSIVMTSIVTTRNNDNYSDDKYSDDHERWWAAEKLPDMNLDVNAYVGCIVPIVYTLLLLEHT